MKSLQLKAVKKFEPLMFYYYCHQRNRIGSDTAQDENEMPAGRELVTAIGSAVHFRIRLANF